jgi:hemolysin activation/secretion protein
MIYGFFVSKRTGLIPSIVLGLAVLFILITPLPSRALEEGVPRFDISSYSVEGNSLLPSASIAPLLKTYTGKDKDFGDVQQALEALEDAYRKKGYNAVAVILPEQELDHGTVRLRVIEGKVREFAVEGNNFHSKENILNTFPSLKIGNTPKVTGLSQDLFVSNENPSKKVSLQMLSGENEDDVIASLKVTDLRPWNVGLMADNTGSATTGDYRLSLLFQHHNVFDRDHSLTLVYNTSPDRMDKVNVFSLGYRIPVYALGDSLEFSAGYSDVNSGSVAFGSYNLLVSGKGVTSAIKYNMNLRRLGDYQHKLTLGFDYKIFENSLNLQGTELGNDLVVHPLSLSYSGMLGMEGGELGLYLSVAHNEPWGGRGGRESFSRARPGANADYTVMRFGTNLLFSLPRDWQAKLTFSGQYSDDLLVPGEQFGAGGSGSVRGFSEREVSGDCGFAGNAEIYSPNLANFLNSPQAQIRLLGFYDAANVFPAKTEAAPDYVISSVGTGLRLSWAANFTCSLDWGYVLRAGGATKQGDSALHFKTMFMY